MADLSAPYPAPLPVGRGEDWLRGCPIPPGAKSFAGGHGKIAGRPEAFGGWFGKQAEDKVRYLFGRNAALVVRVHGLEEAKRFTAGTVEIR